MKLQIKNVWGEVLYEGDHENMIKCLEGAVRAAKSLSGANLSRAYLSGANLSRADLSGAYLSRAYLSGANLSRAYLSGANLSRAYLSGANLSRANLSRADLSGAYLSRAYLSRADLSGAYLSGADLSGAYLSRAYLSRADLSRADLSGAYLSGADLSRANLSRADLSRAKGHNPWRTDHIRLLLDQPGPIRAYKLVTEDFASPISTQNGWGRLEYKIGSVVEEPKADPDEAVQCSRGINLGDFTWVSREWKPGMRILLVEFEAKDIVAIPWGNDGKFRVKKCRIVSECDLVKYGLVEKPAEPAPEKTEPPKVEAVKSASADGKPEAKVVTKKRRK